MLILAAIVPDDDPGMMSNVVTILLAFGAVVVTPISAHQRRHGPALVAVTEAILPE